MTQTTKASKTGLYMVVVNDSGKFYNAIWSFTGQVWQWRKCNVRGDVFNNVSEIDTTDEMMVAYLAQDLKAKKIHVLRTEKTPDALAK